ncbi:hypothetical protein CLV56_1980 [Mumia flava]|uniref:Uncharacterized protein n=1 Tax=Mumia flava TaxID=1348852 RepID=A0A0B2B2Q9_9ACTN|nr:hypothetical protein [Mumia flava]PJJ57742.1 hypothetical protein CLV56_1980 [Mumia flava]
MPSLETVEPDESAPPRPRPGRSLLRDLLVAVAAGCAWWLVGFLPWLVHGAVDVFVGDRTGAFLAVPLTTGALTLLASGALLGGVVAGLAALINRAHPVEAAASGFVGTAVAAALALTQASGTVRDLAGGGFDSDDRVLRGLCLAVALITLAGWVIGTLALLSRRIGGGLALAVLAGVVPTWFVGLLVSSTSATEHLATITTVGRWAGAGVLACALVLVGIRPLVRLVWWPVAVAVAWLVGPAITAAGYLQVYLRPGGGLPDALPEALDATWDVFVAALAPSVRPVTPWIVAVAAAALVAVVVTARRPTDPAGS